MTRKDGKPRSLPTILGLDPLPWKPLLRQERYPRQYDNGLYFDPRPGYSQNPADYGIYDDPCAGDRDVAKFDAHNRWKEQS